MPGLDKFMAFGVLAQLLVSLRKMALVYGVRSILREECLKASSIFFTETVNRSKLVPANANLNFEMEAKK